MASCQPILCFSTIPSRVSRILKGVPPVSPRPKKWAKAAGAELKTYYLTMGRFDEMVIVEAPDDETMAKLAVATAALGNVRTETMRAFTEEEYREIIAGL